MTDQPKGFPFYLPTFPGAPRPYYLPPEEKAALYPPDQNLVPGWEQPWWRRWGRRLWWKWFETMVLLGLWDYEYDGFVLGSGTWWSLAHPERIGRGFLLRAMHPGFRGWWYHVVLGRYTTPPRKPRG